MSTEDGDSLMECGECGHIWDLPDYITDVVRCPKCKIINYLWDIE